MSNLLKSKFLLGVMTFAIMFVGAVALNATPAAADCSLTTTLRVGSKGVEVKCLQTVVGATADGSFGPLTKVSVMAWQSSHGLVADGVVGAKSRAVFNAGGSVSGNFPAGCSSASGFSSTTGVACTSLSANTFAPPGCTAASGFSPSTGGACYAVNANTFPAGCTSAAGFSPTTGQACNGTVVVVVGTGPVTASLSIDNPVARSLVVSSVSNLGEASADLAHFTFTGSGTVTAMNLQRYGISADADLSNVYLYDGATRITDGSSVTSGGAINFTNPAGLFTVNGTKTISVRADIANPGASSTVGIKLVSYVSGGTTTTANLSGNLFTTSTSSQLSAVAWVGSSALPGINTALNPGVDVVVFGTYTVTVSKDAWLTRLALREIGSIATTDIRNFRLYVDGTMVGTAVPSLDANGYVTFDLSSAPLKLLSGSRTFMVKADVVGGSSRTFSFSLRSVADMGLTDGQYGVGLTVGGTKPAAGLQTVTSGSVTVQKDVTSPSGNVTLNGTDVSLAKYKFTVYGEPMKIDTLGLTATSSNGGYTSLRNGRILVNGAQYGSTTNISEVADTTLFTLNTTLPVGDNTIEVRADVYSATGTALAANDTLLITLEDSLTNNGQGTISGTLSMVPSVDKAANSVTVKSGTLAIGRTVSYPAQTTVVPQTNFKLASFQLTGNSTEIVNLNTITVDFVQTAGTFSAANLSNVSIKYNGVAESSVKATVSAAAATNSWSVSHALPVNGTATIDVYADIDSSVTNAATMRTDMSVTGITASSSTTLYTLAGGTSNSTGPAAGYTGQVTTAGVGTMASAVDASSPVAKLMYDTTTNTIGAFKFTSTNDTYTITDATFTLGGATNVVSVALKDGATTLATMPGAATVTFSGLAVTVGGATPTKILTLEATLGTTGVNAGTSNEAITATLTSYKTTSSVGTNATTNVTKASATSYVFAAIPTITQLALPSTVIANGTVTLDKFSMTASGGTIGWNKIMFTSTKTTAPIITVPTLWNVDSNTAVGGTMMIWSNDQTCDASDTSCTFTFVPTSEQQVSGTINYALKATVTGAVVNTDSIQTTIAAPTLATVAGSSGLAYLSQDGLGTVKATDLRYHNIATANVLSAYAQTVANGVVTFLTSTNTDEVMSFGTIPNSTIILTETANGSLIIGPITGTLVDAGWTCDAYTTANAAGTITTTIANIYSIKCTNGTDNQVVLNTTPIADSSAIVKTTITLTTGAYTSPADGVVGVNDSDLGLPILLQTTSPSLMWSDLSASAHSVGTLDWYNDFLVKNLPLDTANLQ